MASRVQMRFAYFNRLPFNSRETYDLPKSVVALTLARCLQLTEITVPDVVDVRETVTLSCSYDMGTHKLNSVKWYKDEREFFRYSPLMPKSLMLFDVEGVTVLQNSTGQICNQFMCSIQLHRLNIRSSGSYRCEISGDAPEFKLAHGVGNMTVAVKQ
uniref:Ig-like domain-containing protein n=1 Tax=Anopheles melas TaxID=34690 RepID=A0A182TX33_9DIPT